MTNFSPSQELSFLLQIATSPPPNGHDTQAGEKTPGAWRELVGLVSVILGEGFKGVLGLAHQLHFPGIRERERPKAACKAGAGELPGRELALVLTSIQASQDGAPRSSCCL